MITVTPLNTNQYNQFAVGDIITAYHSGFHRIIGFHKVSHSNEIQIEYKKELYANGKPCRYGKVNSCASEYCKVVGAQTIARIYKFEADAAATKFQNLNILLGGICEV
jgi:hypothetical protein